MCAYIHECVCVCVYVDLASTVKERLFLRWFGHVCEYNSEAEATVSMETLKVGG